MEILNGDTNKISQIQTFYEGLNVFITGGTGFMGKILIEKLLRSTAVSTIYILIRKKKGKDMHTRLEELFDDMVFDRLKRECKFKHRIVGISGDCSVPGLGLNISDRKTLIDTTNIVFHCAATVRFDEALKLAYKINVLGTRDMLNLSRDMRNLKALVHVSTAYANCQLPKIDETFYDYSLKDEDLEFLLEKMDEEKINKMTNRILGDWPNTYTFTKAMAERVIKNHGGVLPIAIFRPGIVVSTFKEPMPGWIDNVYGPTGACAAAATGLLRILYCDKDVTANIVPVDSSVAALIAIAWDCGQKNREDRDIPIYNYVSSEDNPITWGEYNSLNMVYAEKFPLTNAVWIILFQTTTSKTIYAIKKLFYHLVPALIFDLACLTFAQKPRLVSMYKKIHKLSDVIAHFCTRDWKFTSRNTKLLWEKMNEKDREVFPYDIRMVHWVTYFKTYMLGIRKYLMKDSMDTIVLAQKRQRRFKIMQSVVQYCTYFLVAHVVWSQIMSVWRTLFPVPASIWHKITS